MQKKAPTFAVQRYAEVGRDPRLEVSETSFVLISLSTVQDHCEDPGYLGMDHRACASKTANTCDIFTCWAGLQNTEGAVTISWGDLADCFGLVKALGLQPGHTVNGHSL